MTRLRVVRENEREYQAQQPAHALAEAALSLAGYAHLWGQWTQDTEDHRSEFLVAMISGLSVDLDSLRKSVAKAAKVRNPSEGDWQLCMVLLRRHLREAK